MAQDGGKGKPESPDECVIDGVSYPRCINLINAIRRSEPRLLENNPDARKVRKWLRENRREDDGEPAGWVGHLFFIAAMTGMMNDSETRVDEWRKLGVRNRERKADNIFNLITKLIKALSDEDLPIEPPKAYELFDSYAFFWSSLSDFPKSLTDSYVEGKAEELDDLWMSFFVREYAIKEKKISIYDESIIDILKTLRARYLNIDRIGTFRDWQRESKGRGGGDEESPSITIRGYACDLMQEIERRYRPEEDPNEIVAAILSIRFPDTPVTNENVRMWVRACRNQKK